MATELPTTVILDGTSSFDPDGTIVGYRWSLSDGRVFNQPMKEIDFTEGESGSYTANLTVTDDEGATAGDSVEFTLEEPTNELPDADFTVTPERATPPFTAKFDASPSSDPDGSIVGYKWEFFDEGIVKNGKVVTKRYTKDDYGPNIVGLSVTDDDGEAGGTTGAVDVIRPENEPPNAVIQADKQSGRAPLTVTFDASGSTPGNDPYDPELSFDWFVNQNSVSNSGPTFTETFDAGTQQVTVEVTDSQGATDSASATVDVKLPPNDPPTALADATPRSVETPAEVEFTGRNSSDPNNNIDSYEWKFSDGTTKAGKTVKRSFGKDAPQQVTGTLTVTDTRGETDTDSVTVTLSQPGGIIGGVDNETVAQATIIGAGIASSLIFD